MLDLIGKKSWEEIKNCLNIPVAPIVHHVTIDNKFICSLHIHPKTYQLLKCSKHKSHMPKTDVTSWEVWNTLGYSERILYTDGRGIIYVPITTLSPEANLVMQISSHNGEIVFNFKFTIGTRIIHWEGFPKLSLAHSPAFWYSILTDLIGMSKMLYRDYIKPNMDTLQYIANFELIYE